MADWYVFQHDGAPLGPWSTDTVADAILAGKLAADVWVAAPGGPRWLRALDVPVIARLVDASAAKPRRRDSGLRLRPVAYVPESSTDAYGDAYGATMMIVDDAEVQLSDTEASAIARAEAAERAARAAPVTTLGDASDASEITEMFASMHESRASELVITDDPPTEPAPPPSWRAPEDPRAARESAEVPSTERRRRRTAQS